MCSATIRCGREVALHRHRQSPRFSSPNAADGLHHGVLVVAEEAGAAVVDHLGGRPLGEGQDRRAAGQGLDHDHAERLVPPDGEQERRGAGQQLQLALVGHLAQVVGIVARGAAPPARGSSASPTARASWPPGRSGCRPCGRSRWPGGPPCRRPSGPGRGRRALLVTGSVSHREVRGVDAVVDDPGDGDVRGRPPLGVGDGHDGDPVGVGPVEVGELLVERSVDGGGHRQARDTARSRRDPSWCGRGPRRSPRTAS